MNRSIEYSEPTELYRALQSDVERSVDTVRSPALRCLDVLDLCF